MATAIRCFYIKEISYCMAAVGVVKDKYLLCYIKGNAFFLLKISYCMTAFMWVDENRYFLF